MQTLHKNQKIKANLRIERNITKDSSADLALVDKLSGILGEISQLLTFDHSYIFLWDELKNRLELFSTFNRSDRSSGLKLSEITNLAEFAYYRQNTIIFPQHKDTVRVDNSLLFHPLFKDEKCIGVVAFYSAKSPAFKSADKEILNSFYEVILQALSEQSGKMQQEWMTIYNYFLQRVARLCRVSADIKEIGTGLFRMCQSLFDINLLGLAIYSEDLKRLNYHLTISGDKINQQQQVEIGPHPHQQIIDHDRAIQCNLIADYHDFLSPGDSFSEKNSVMIMPISYLNTVTGYFYLQSPTPNAFGEWHSEFLNIVSSFLTLAIEREKTASEDKKSISYLAEALDEAVVLLDSQLRTTYSSPKMQSLLAGKEFKRFLSEAGIYKTVWPDSKGGKRLTQLFTNKDNEFELISFAVKEGYFVIVREISKQQRSLTEQYESKKLKQLIYTIRALAHKMNQPLTGISCYCSLLLEDKSENSPQYEELTEIDEQINRLEALIRKLDQITRVNEEPSIDDEEIC